MLILLGPKLTDGIDLTSLEMELEDIIITVDKKLGIECVQIPLLQVLNHVNNTRTPLGRDILADAYFAIATMFGLYGTSLLNGNAENKTIELNPGDVGHPLYETHESARDLFGKIERGGMYPAKYFLAEYKENGLLDFTQRSKDEPISVTIDSNLLADMARGMLKGGRRSKLKDVPKPLLEFDLNRQELSIQAKFLPQVTKRLRDSLVIDAKLSSLVANSSYKQQILGASIHKSYAGCKVAIIKENNKMGLSYVKGHISLELAQTIADRLYGESLDPQMELTKAAAQIWSWIEPTLGAALAETKELVRTYIGWGPVKLSVFLYVHKRGGMRHLIATFFLAPKGEGLHKIYRDHALYGLNGFSKDYGLVDWDVVNL